MAGIDDWYLNRAHRRELAAEYSADDDLPDPVVFGEVPGREWIVPRRTTTGSRGRSHRARVPKPDRKRRSQKKTAAHDTPKPTFDARRQKIAGNNRGRHFAAWQQFALRWLRANPGASNRELKAAVEEAGFLPLVKAEIAALRAEVATARRAPRRKYAPPVRRSVQPLPTASPILPVRYCDSCGLAVTNDGRCRC